MTSNAISDAQLDPELFGVSADKLAAIPLAVLLANHPGLAAQLIQNQSQAQAQQMQPLNQSATTSTAVMNPPLNPPPTLDAVSSTAMSSAAVSSTGGEGTDVEVDDTVPSRPLSSFEHPELMLWNYEDAKTMKDSFSRVDCTRNPDGTCVKKAQIARMSKGVTFACAFLFDMDIHEYLEGSVRNYRFFRENYMHLLLGIAKSLEEKFPVLSWCTFHYKALKWIEYHLKQHNEQIAKKKRLAASAATAAASSSSASTSHPSSSTSNSTGQHGKSRKTKRAADVDLKPAKTSKKLKKKHPLNEIDDNMFSEDDDDESAVHSSKPAPKSKAKLVVPPLNLLSDDDDVDEDEDDDEVAYPSILTTKPKAKLVVHDVASIPDNGNTSTKPAAAPSAALPIPKQQIQIPGRVDSSIHASDPAPSARKDLVLPTLKAARTSVASTLAKSVNTFQKTATEAQIDSTVDGIRAVLPRFSALEEIDLVRATLQTLEVAKATGLDPQAAGDLNFIKWLERLEELQEPPAEMDPDEREDQMGVSFGHKEIGTWSYHHPLKDIANWGCVANACRLLSALLRIWSMARSQMKTSDSSPLIHNHIRQVCDIIQEAFKTTSGTKEKPANAPTSAGQRSTTASKEASSSFGKVSEPRLRRLSKKLAMPLLEKAGIKIPGRATRSEVTDMLVTSWKSGKLSITAKELQEIEPGKQKAE
ncbi:hypothetical protein CF326_g6403 [Tilletia indica]|nr:hypothetical protein CF326_g6403 [Tilletia indica]